MESLIFAFNAIMPIILVIMLGYILKKAGFLTPEFLKIGNKFVFKVSLPALLFMNVYSIGSFAEIDFTFIIYALIGILCFFFIGIAVVKKFVSDDKQKGVILQAIFRSNYAIIGIPLAESLGGIGARGAAAVLSAFSIPLYNILAVISLTMFVTKSEGNSKGKLKNVIVNIAKNPLIIGVVLGLITLGIRSLLPIDEAGHPVFSLQYSLPFLYTSIKNVSALATPLALIVLGGNFNFESISGNLKLIIFGSATRIVIVPSVLIALACVLSSQTSFVNFTKDIYPSYIALFATPVAVSSAIMAEQMDNDGQLAGQLVVWTSLFSIVTIFLFIVILRNLGLL